MPTQFIKDLSQCALAVDIVNEEILRDVGQLLSEYFRESLCANTFEVRIEAPSGRSGERFLKTLWSVDGREFTAPLFRDDGGLRGHTSYAVNFDKSLWIVSLDSGKNLVETDAYCDMWSGVEDLPPYRGWGDDRYSTAVIIPIGRPARGFLNLEFCDRLELCGSAKEELLEVAKIINIIYGLYDSHRTQTSNTNNAVRNLNARIPQSPLLRPKMFLAFSSRAEEEVVGIVKTVLGHYEVDLEIVAWDNIRNSGNVNVQIATAIKSAAFGVCYLSEPAKTASEYQDNPNVVFEAGMFHALSSPDLSKTRWIPIREKNSGPAPFDFASERLLEVPRQPSGSINDQALRTSLKDRVDALLDHGA